MSTPIHARVASLAMLLGLSAACRPGEGDPCLCHDDCRKGLVCAVGGRVLREGDACVHATGTQPAGECVAASDVPEDADDLEDPPLYFDLGTRRDLDPGRPPDGETGATTTGTDTGTTTTDATDDTSTGTTVSTDETDTGTGTTVGTGETSTDTGR